MTEHTRRIRIHGLGTCSAAGELEDCRTIGRTHHTCTTGMSYGVEVLVERLLAAKGPVAIIALVYSIVSWGFEVLVEGLLTAKRLVALIALENWSGYTFRVVGRLAYPFLHLGMIHFRWKSNSGRGSSVTESIY